ncbi:prepilin-type N-terminal cleavage/methylation domain-containing protein [bacterium]|nr:prepilin-type N-terminal cleavage/methylation domain-containing protein [bacterium]
MIRTRKEKGFTLIELLVVVTIIGILAAAAIPKLMAAMDKARLGRCKSDAAAVRGAAQMYNMDKGNWPTGLSAMATEYLPVSPPPGPTTEAMGWAVASAGGDYTITCRGTGAGCYVYFQASTGVMNTGGTSCP